MKIDTLALTAQQEFQAVRNEAREFKGEILEAIKMLAQKIDNLDTRLSKRIDNLDTHLSKRIDDLDVRLSAKIENLDMRFSAHDTRVNNLDVRLRVVERRA